MSDKRNGVMTELKDAMNKVGYEEYKESFISERLSMLNRNGELLPDDEANRIAGECWERYRRANGLLLNEQKEMSR